MIPIPWTSIGGFLWRARKWIAIALAVLGLIAGFLLYRHSLIERGREEVQALWDADELSEKAVADEQIRKNQLEDAADEARNAQVAKKYADDLDAAAADNARLERMLRKATAAASASRTSQGPDQPRAAEASPAGSDEPAVAGAGIHQLIAGALTEARQNADQLDAVLAELGPQMD